MKKKYEILIYFVLPVILLIAAIAISSLTIKPEKLHCETRQYPIMGTMAQVTVYGSKELTEKAADAVQDEFIRVENHCNIFNPDSELSRLNKSAFNEPFKCSDLLWDILMESKRFYQISNGAFDISAKPLMKLWGFYRKQKKLPDQSEIDKVLKYTGLDKVKFNEQDHSIKFTIPDLSLDLGGIAKGYAVGLAAKKAKELGISRGLINLGGNMYCFPEPPPGKKAYTIAIRNPLDKSTVCGTVDLKNTSVATSGNYERYVIIDGQRYTHIMNVKTGKPVKNMLSATVITPLATDSDALSTSIFINGEAFARKICAKFPATSVLIIRHPENQPDKTEVIKIGSIWKNIEL
jgi:thiamine biosynthesis lipoprotein